MRAKERGNEGARDGRVEVRTGPKGLIESEEVAHVLETLSSNAATAIFFPL